jgi:putative two-component system response regulator
MKAMNECNILIVDDTRVNLEILVEILGDLYEVSIAMDGKTALEMASTYAYDLILLDIMMPEMDGFEVIAHLKENPETAGIPVIFISALSEVSNKTQAFNMGALDYIVKPFNIDEVLSRVKTHLSLRLAQKELENQNALLEMRVKERTREIVMIQQATLMSFATLAEFRDMETGAHIKRIKEYTMILAEALQKNEMYKNYITDQYIDLLGISSPLHDIGKVGIPDSILLKAGKLTDEEYDIMKNHTTFGKMAIETVENDLMKLPFLHLAKEIAYSHHEKYDGSGYPRGLVGDEIPLSGRIVAVADVFDGLVSRRVYKPPFPLSQALEIIIEGKGTHFDPDVVDALLASLERICEMGVQQADSEEEKEIFRKHHDLNIF